MSGEDENKTVREMIKDYFNSIIHKEIFVKPTINDVIGTNAKIVIFALFGLILASIIMYSSLITGKFNPDSPFGQTHVPTKSLSEAMKILSEANVKSDTIKELQNLIAEKLTYDTIEEKIYYSILTSGDNDSQKLEEIKKFNDKKISYFQDRFKQIEQIDTVFIAAITGAVALGGSLITQLWGRRQS